MKTICASLTILCCLTGNSCYGQDIDFGGQSEASRFLNNFKRQASASVIKNDIVRRATSAANGFGTASSIAPVGILSPSAPPRSRSASFGTGGASPVAKPFSSVTPRPTVSPYLSLFNETIGENNDLNYQTLVRPQLQQQQFNQQVVRQAQTINRRLTAISARNAFNTTGAQTVMPTGHAASFQNYSRFYPQMSRRRR